MKWLRGDSRTSGIRRWTYAADGIFWRMKISEYGKILCEIRNPETKTAWFDCLDEKTGATVWNGLRFEEPWWIGIEEITSKFVYFHGYRKPDMPQHLGIIAVDIETGKLCWTNADLSFAFADEHAVYGFRQGFESRMFLKLDPVTGAPDSEPGVDPAEMNTMRAAQNEEYFYRNYQYPVHFDEQHPEFESCKSCVMKRVDISMLRGTLDFLKLGGAALISWHETAKDHSESAPRLNQLFLAVEIASNSVIYEDTINGGVSAPSVDSFFVKDGTVYYIQDMHVLTALEFPFE